MDLQNEKQTRKDKGNIMLSLIGILAGVIVLIVGAFKRIPMIPLSLIAALLVVLTGDLSGLTVMEALKGTFLAGFASFMQGYFLLLSVSTLFASLMASSGCATSIAQGCIKVVRKFPGNEKFMALVALIVVTSIFTAGGISAFVCVFVMLPIGKRLFEELDIPWHLFTVFCLGNATYSLGGDCRECLL